MALRKTAWILHQVIMHDDAPNQLPLQRQSKYNTPEKHYLRAENILSCFQIVKARRYITVSAVNLTEFILLKQWI